MGNEPGKLTSKHLDKNHIFENHIEIHPKPISLSTPSLTSQKSLSLPHNISKKVDFRNFSKKAIFLIKE